MGHFPLCLGYGGIVQPEAHHLAPHVGVVTAVEIEERHHPSIFRLLGIGGGEPLRIGPVAVEVEIHGEKSNLGGHVAEAKSFVEFDAVKEGYVFI